MKIENIELRHIKMPLASPFTTSMDNQILFKINARDSVWLSCLLLSGCGNIDRLSIQTVDPVIIQCAGVRKTLTGALLPGRLYPHD